MLKIIFKVLTCLGFSLFFTTGILGLLDSLKVDIEANKSFSACIFLSCLCFLAYLQLLF